MIQRQKIQEKGEIMAVHTMEELVALCKKRGFVFQSSEIYGGLRGVYDLGPLGIELKKISEMLGGKVLYMNVTTLKA